MSKLLKYLSVPLLLLAVAVGLVPFLVDSDRLKHELQTEFQAATGRPLVIDGEMDISLFPRPAVELADVRIPGAFGGAGSYLAQADLLRFYPKIAALFAGHLEWDLVRAEALRLRLIRDEQGNANWEVGEATPVPTIMGRVEPPRTGNGRLAPDRPSPHPSPRGRGGIGAPSAPSFTVAGAAQVASAQLPAVPTQSPGPFDLMAAETPPRPEGLVVDNVEILDGQVTWDDRSRGQQFELDDVQIFAGPLTPAEPLPWRMTGMVPVSGSDSPARISGEGSLSESHGWRQLSFAPLTLRLDRLEFQDGLFANLVVHTDLSVDRGTERYLARALKLDLRASGAKLTGGEVTASAKADFELDLGGQRLQITGLSVRSGDLAAHGSVMGERLSSDPVLTGNLAVDQLDLRAWLKQQGLPLPRTTDVDTFRRIVLNTRWRFEDAQLGFQDIALGIDQTAVTGDLSLVGTSPLECKFDLVADRLDLDPYLPVIAEATPPKTSQAPTPTPLPAALKAVYSERPAASPYVKTAAAPARPVAARFSILATSAFDLDLNGRLRVGELKLARLRFGDADLHIRGKDGRFEIDDQSPRFYQGRLTGKLGLNVTGAEPAFTLDQRAENIEAGGLLADLGFGNRFAGRGAISANLAGTGSSAVALRRSLSGNLAVRVPQGAVEGVNLEKLVREAAARLQGKQPPANLPNRTDFKDLQATADVKNGILHNRDLTATTDYLRVTGAGTLDLVQERYDYRFEPVFVKPPRGRGIKELEDIPIPVHLTGPFDDPKWKVDVASALRAAAQHRLDKQGDDLFKKLEDRTGIKGLEKGLKSLLGR